MPRDTLWLERIWSRSGAETGWIESRWARVNGQLMHARITTSPARFEWPPVVLVHGIGVTSRYWVPTMLLLAPESRVYAPDLPGFGRTFKPQKTLSVTELSDWLAAWMRSFGIERVVLVGNSFGCQTAADFAVRYPEMTVCMVLVGPTTDPQAQTWYEQVLRWRQNTPREPPTHRWVSVQDYSDCGIPRILRTFAESLRDHIEGNLPHVQAPTMVVRGSVDDIVPRRWAEEAARLLPRGRLVEIPGAPHTINFSYPLELVRVLRPFLREMRAAQQMREAA